jgi:hypothetical protein
MSSILREGCIFCTLCSYYLKKKKRVRGSETKGESKRESGKMNEKQRSLSLFFFLSLSLSFFFSPPLSISLYISLSHAGEEGTLYAGAPAALLYTITRPISGQ